MSQHSCSLEPPLLQWAVAFGSTAEIFRCPCLVEDDGRVFSDDADLDVIFARDPGPAASHLQRISLGPGAWRGVIFVIVRNELATFLPSVAVFGRFIRPLWLLLVLGLAEAGRRFADADAGRRWADA